LAQLFDRTRTILETGVSDYAPNPILQVDAAYVATPVLSENRIVGVLVLRMGARRLLDGVNNHAGLGRSGETLVAVRRESEAVVVAPLRSDRTAAFKATVPLTNDPLNVVARAVEGGRGVGFGRDQRGVEVFAVWRYIPAIRWGIVVKVDREEAFGPVKRLGRIFTWITVVTAIAVLALAFSQARRLSLPILALRRATQRVADGDFNVQIEVKSRNEIAELAETFRLMATRLNDNFEDLKRTTAEREKAAREAIEAKAQLEEANATLESKVATRTAELSQRNAELQDTLDKLGRAQQQLIVREKMASLGETVAGVAHEISNPLNFVVNFSDLSREALSELKTSIGDAKAHLPENDRADIEEVAGMLEDNLGRIREHGRRAQEIVRSMIDITRGNAGERRAVDLNALVRDYSRAAYQGHRSRETGPEVTMQFELDETLPEISVYTSGISRVMANIVGNALWSVTEQHKRAGNGYLPTITITTKQREKEIQIVVRDNGIGVAPEHVGKVFQPFFTTRPTGSGSTGLGLSMAWEIVVNQHHGRLELASEPGKGAEFTIALPTE